MSNTSNARRRFLTVLAAAGTLLVLRSENLGGQAKPSGRPPAPDPTPESDSPLPTPGKSPTKAILEANEKDIKKNIEKLYQLATDLKVEIEKTDSSQVLSLAMVKKAEEIEKLAHEIKTRAKG
jgi:hypothetical protein